MGGGKSKHQKEFEKLFDQLGDLISKNIEKGEMTHEEARSSLAYLKREDVRNTAYNFIKDMDSVTIDSGLKRILGIVYAEMKITSDNGKIYQLNLWPCHSCACVGFKEEINS